MTDEINKNSSQLAIAGINPSEINREADLYKLYSHINHISDQITENHAKAIDTRKQLEDQHFATMDKMRQRWQEQLENMKQAHLGAKKDLEDLIAHREKQLEGIDKGK